MSIKGKKKKESLLFVLRSSFQLSSGEASRSQQGLVGCVRAPEGCSSYMYSEEEQKESLLLLSLRVKQRVSTAQSFSFSQDSETLASSLGGSGQMTSTEEADERRAKEGWDGPGCSLQVDTPQVSG